MLTLAGCSIGLRRNCPRTGFVAIPFGLMEKEVKPVYFTIRPQAMRSPALPAGSLFMSSALA
jgi:hypothetical protein